MSSTDWTASAADFRPIILPSLRAVRRLIEARKELDARGRE